ncbi:hypothetical protein AAC387_Pa09g1415 [Persea americana]
MIFWADSVGSKYICSRLEAWANTYGDFLKPCAYLAERASKGIFLVPNGIGFLLGTAQLILYAIYRNTKGTNKTQIVVGMDESSQPLIQPLQSHDCDSVMKDIGVLMYNNIRTL